LGYEPDGGAASAYEPTSAQALTTAPAPAVIYVGPDGEPTAAPNFQDFVRFIMASDLDRAAAVLSPLLDLPAARSRACTERFRDQLRDQPQFVQKAMGLRHELANGTVNGALILLWECFGLQGLESITALQCLRARMSAGANAAG